MKNSRLFYKQKPLFGLDIGSSTVKVVQIKQDKKQPRLLGYGYADFDPKAIEEGVIVNQEPLETALRPLLKKIVIGKLTTDRVFASIPTGHIYSRMLELNDVAEADLPSAVELEAQQYVPLKKEDIYLDFSVLEVTKDSKTRVLMVAAPKKIIDSYLKLFGDLGLEVYGTEPSLLSIIRSVNRSLEDQNPKIIIDFGSRSSDFAVFDKSLQLTSTTATGGDQITDCIMETLGVELEEAREIKSRYGIGKGKYQEKLAPALSPLLSNLATEVQKLLRYHHEQEQHQSPIAEIVIVGGGAKLPGLDNFLTQLTGITVSTCDPWKNILIKPLQPPHQLETTLYTTAVGLALKELDR